MTETTYGEQTVALVEPTIEKSEQITTKPTENQVSKENIALRRASLLQNYES